MSVVTIVMYVSLFIGMAAFMCTLEIRADMRKERYPSVPGNA